MHRASCVDAATRVDVRTNMSAAQHDTIDFITLDPRRDVVVLVMIEERPWGASGLLLPDVQAKLNTYLEYVTAGRLTREHPVAADKGIRRTDLGPPQ